MNYACSYIGNYNIESLTRTMFFKRLFFLATCFVLAGAGNSQLTFKDYFNEQTPLTYLGIDFTEIKLAGFSEEEMKDMAEKQFGFINNLIINEDEKKKFNLPEFFHKRKVEKDISFSEEHNFKIEADKVKSAGGDDENRLTPAAVEKLIAGYDFADKEGMGAMIVAESFNRTKEQGTAYIVFIDLTTRKILYSEKFTEKGGGFGVRNFWSRVFYNLLLETDSKYKKWKKENSL